MKKKVIVIGAGFSGLAASCFLAKAGHEVTLLEKNEMTGGRCRVFEAEGFVFDMGPSWYWMPDVFEHFFAQFGKKVSDFYDLKRLDPSYRVYFGDSTHTDLPASMQDLEAVFEQYEPGSTPRLRQFLKDAAYKYTVGMGDFVHKPSHSVMEYADIRILKSMVGLNMFSSISKEIRGLFKHPKLVQILEFPVLFLGAKPENTPSLYSLMNYADMVLGTWYPMGGMYKIIEGMTSLAQSLGVNILLNQEVVSLTITSGRATHVLTKGGGHFDADVIVGSADYHHLDADVLGDTHRNYGEQYWDKRVMAPSSLLFYVGVNKRLQGLRHHNLMFDADFGKHAAEIYDHPQWPSDPLYYVSCPSVTDPTVAPEGMENLFLLIPVAPGLTDTPEMREHYYRLLMERLEATTAQNIRDHVVYKRSYAHADFEQDYHAYKGNAYGLANTLMQTAFLKPKIKNKHINNFFYTGQLTTPGPGVPPSLVSGEVVAKEVNNYLSTT